MSYFVLIRGPLGVGKTAIAKKLAKEIDAEYIDVDKVLNETEWTEQDGYVSEASFINTNKILASLAEEILQSGKSVVFDGEIYYQSAIEDLIKRLDYANYVLSLKAPLAVCIERDAGRENSIGKDAADAVYRKSSSLQYGIEIDASGDIDTTIENIKKELKKGNYEI